MGRRMGVLGAWAANTGPLGRGAEEQTWERYTDAGEGTFWMEGTVALGQEGGRWVESGDNGGNR